MTDDKKFSKPPKWPIGNKCEEDGCVVNYSPDGSTRPYWCQHASEEEIKVGNKIYTYCTAYKTYVLICET